MEAYLVLNTTQMDVMSQNIPTTGLMVFKQEWFVSSPLGDPCISLTHHSTLMLII